MKVAYLDCFSGISGDMMLGALVHAGVDPELFRRTVSALGVNARIEVHAVNRSGISSTKVDVITGEAGADDQHVVLEPKHEHEHGHDHHHEHSHDHEHKDHTHEHHDHGRSLHEIEKLIGAGKLEPAVRDLALRAFRLLGEAEAKIHNIPLEEIHFHEVGAVDAIVDITCAAAGCVSLGVERWLCSPVNVGGGTVKCAHGVFPVPAPATAELLKGARVYSSGINAELVTPTGAAILRALNVEYVAMPELTIDRIGYGAGSRDLQETANVARITIGDAVTQSENADVVTVIETAVDDLTPEVISYVIEQTIAAGALDAMAAPVQMKKGRPGHLITALCRPEDGSRISGLLLRETSALGVRMRQENRRVMQRKLETVSTPWGEVRVKLGYLDGELANCAPEFEDCRRVAQEHGVPLKMVMQEALRAYATTSEAHPSKTS
jgi:uncharacterized protein (TIGR00299 family) protein